MLFYLLLVLGGTIVYFVIDMVYDEETWNFYVKKGSVIKRFEIN